MSKKAKDAARKARNDVYRQHILEAAEEVFADKGFEAAKLQDIGTRAGLSMGTIYAIFPGKTELFTAILEERGREVADLVEAIARAETSPSSGTPKPGSHARRPSSRRSSKPCPTSCSAPTRAGS